MLDFGNPYGHLYPPHMSKGAAQPSPLHIQPFSPITFFIFTHPTQPPFFLFKLTQPMPPFFCSHSLNPLLQKGQTTLKNDKNIVWKENRKLLKMKEVIISDIFQRHSVFWDWKCGSHTLTQTRTLTWPLFLSESSLHPGARFWLTKNATGLEVFSHDVLQWCS